MCVAQSEVHNLDDPSLRGSFQKKILQNKYYITHCIRKWIHQAVQQQCHTAEQYVSDDDNDDADDGAQYVPQTIIIRCDMDHTPYIVSCHVMSYHVLLYHVMLYHVL